MAPLVRTGGSRHTGLAAPPHRNIQGPGLTMNNSLAEVHPELVSEWSEENLPLTPDDITFGSNEKVWWKEFIPDSKNGSLFA